MWWYPGRPPLDGCRSLGQFLFRCPAVEPSFRCRGSEAPADAWTSPSRRPKQNGGGLSAATSPPHHPRGPSRSQPCHHNKGPTENRSQILLLPSLLTNGVCLARRPPTLPRQGRPSPLIETFLTLRPMAEDGKLEANTAILSKHPSWPDVFVTRSKGLRSWP